MDILKVAYDVKQVNKGGPPSIVVEITLAAPPEAQLVNYTANGDAGGDCFVDVSYRPGTVLSQTHGIPAAQFWIGCGDAGELVAAKTLIKGNVITMSTALDSIPKTIRENGELTGLSATSEIAEPVTGIVGTAIIGGADEATTDKTFRYA